MDLAPVIGEVSEADWVRFKDVIRELYLVRGNKLLGDGSVQQEMKERYNFNQT
jgi:Clr5 domain